MGEHRPHRRQPGAAGDHQHRPVGVRVQAQPAVGRAEADRLPRPRGPDQRGGQGSAVDRPDVQVELVPAGPGGRGERPPDPRSQLGRLQGQRLPGQVGHHPLGAHPQHRQVERAPLDADDVPVVPGGFMLGGELRTEQARPENPERHVQPLARHGTDRLVRPGRREQGLQFEDVLREAVG